MWSRSSPWLPTPPIRCLLSRTPLPCRSRVACLFPSPLSPLSTSSTASPSSVLPLYACLALPRRAAPARAPALHDAVSLVAAPHQETTRAATARESPDAGVRIGAFLDCTPGTHLDHVLGL